MGTEIFTAGASSIIMGRTSREMKKKVASLIKTFTKTPKKEIGSLGGGSAKAEGVDAILSHNIE